MPYDKEKYTKAWVLKSVYNELKELGETYQLGIAEVIRILVEELERLYGGKDGLSLIIKRRMERVKENA